MWRDLAGEALRGATRQAVPHGLHRAPHVIDEACPLADELIARPQNGEVLLGLGPAVLDRVEERGIRAPLPGQELGVEPVVAPAPPLRAVHRAWIRYEHLVPESREQTREPRRMRAHLQHHAAASETRKASRDRRLRGGNGLPAHDDARGVHAAQVALSIAEIQSDR